MKRWISFIMLTIGLCLSTFSSCLADIKVAVLYPEVSKPYSIVFDQIIEGIASHSDVDMEKLGIPEDKDIQHIQEWLDSVKPDAIIAMGRRGTEIVHNLKPQIPTVIGGILHISESYVQDTPGISLTPDPDLLFKRLTTFSPNISRVSVVYNPDNYAWLIERAEKVAPKWNLKINAVPANNIRESARAHKEILDQSNGDKDAIWLLQDPTTVGTESILPYVLKESWEKKLLIFSSNPEHVARGVLFSLFADNVKLGAELAALAISQTKGNLEISNELIPLTSVRIAVNIRTAGHIGLRIPFESQREFDLVFPRR